MGDFVLGDKYGDTVHGDKHVHNGLAEPAATRRPRADGRPDTILLLSANPGGHLQLQLDQERRAIDQEVAASRASARLEVRTADAVRLDDLQQAMLRYRPLVAHFSGHGHAQNGIQVVDEAGQIRSVPPRALSGLFRILGGGVQCVVLNACHTDDQAAAIAAHVPCVVGMRREVLDHSAILFATGFYRGLADGQTVRTSFQLACNGLDLHDRPDRTAPRLIAQPGAADRPLVDPG